MKMVLTFRKDEDSKQKMFEFIKLIELNSIRMKMNDYDEIELLIENVSISSFHQKYIREYMNNISCIEIF